MENKQEKLTGQIGRVVVEGKDYEDFNINYLHELVNQHQYITDINDRLKAYIQYFVDNFNYNKEEFKRITGEYSTGSTETTDKNIENLFRFLKNRSGVCQQFSQALALIGVLDKQFLENNIYINYTTCEVFKDIEMGHAINLINKDGKYYFVDMSSMVHTRDGEYKGSVWDFGMVSEEQYIESINANNMDIISINKESDEHYLFKYNIYRDHKMYHLVLNLSNDELKADNFKLSNIVAKPYILFKNVEKNVEVNND